MIEERYICNGIGVIRELGSLTKHIKLKCKGAAGMERTIEYKRVVATRTKEDAIKSALMSAYAHPDAPTDKDAFEIEAYESTLLIVSPRRCFDVDYKAEIGYKKKEYNKYGELEEVINWQPYEGSETSVFGEGWCILGRLGEEDLGDISNEDYLFDEHYYLNPDKFFDDYHTREVVDCQNIEEIMPIYEEGKERMKIAAFTAAQNKLRDIPGDVYRNLNAKPSRVYDYEHTVVYAVPKYKVALRYGDQLRIDSSGGVEWGNFHFGDLVFEKTEKNEEDVDAAIKAAIEADEYVAKYTRLWKIGLFSSLGLFVIGIFLWGLLAAIGLIGLPVSYFAFSWKAARRKGEITRQFTDSKTAAVNDLRSKKIEAINLRLTEMGIPPLDEKDLESFQWICDYIAEKNT